MALDFNGTSDELTCTSSVLGNTMMPMTMAGWCKLDSTTGEHAIVGVGNSSSSAPIAFLHVKNNKPRLFARDNVNQTTEALGVTNVGTTAVAHLAATLVSGGSEVFLNGVSDDTGPAGATGATTLDRTTIGVLHVGGSEANYFNGQLAEIGVWNVQLTAAEIAALAAGFSPMMIRPSALVLYAPLVRDILDRKGNAFTASGTTVVAHPRIIYPHRKPAWHVAAAGGGGVAEAKLLVPANMRGGMGSLTGGFQ